MKNKLLTFLVIILFLNMTNNIGYSQKGDGAKKQHTHHSYTLESIQKRKSSTKDALDAILKKNLTFIHN